MSQALLIPGIGRPNLQRLLFGSNEQGWLYDWSDRSTLFRDPAGTLPVTASGQTVGLHLDKSKGLVLGAELVTNGEFNDGPEWSAGGTGVSRSGGKLIWTSSPNNSGLFQSSASYSNGVFQVEIVIDSITEGAVTVTLGIGVPAPSNSVVLSTPGTHTFICGNLTGDSFLRVYSSGASTTAVADSISVRELPGNHRYSTNADTRPQYVEDETGHYGLSDGVDDFMETNAVDFTATDKMTVWWGGRKLSDATIGTILESSASSGLVAGSFMVTASGQASAGAKYGCTTRGTALLFADTPASFAAPTSNVVTLSSDIGQAIAIDEMKLRVNGVLQALTITGTDAGTGNFGNHKLYFGRRGGASLPANIREYMCIGRGAQTATPLIQRVENEVRRKIKGLVF